MDPIKMGDVFFFSVFFSVKKTLPQEAYKLHHFGQARELWTGALARRHQLSHLGPAQIGVLRPGFNGVCLEDGLPGSGK